VPGASEPKRRVRVTNANWIVGGEGQDGRFELMIITPTTSITCSPRIQRRRADSWPLPSPTRSPIGSDEPNAGRRQSQGHDAMNRKTQGRPSSQANGTSSLSPTPSAAAPLLRAVRGVQAVADQPADDRRDVDQRFVSFVHPICAPGRRIAPAGRTAHRASSPGWTLQAVPRPGDISRSVSIPSVCTSLLRRRVLRLPAPTGTGWRWQAPSSAARRRECPHDGWTMIALRARDLTGGHRRPVGR
jgi:hypothetical protein